MLLVRPTVASTADPKTSTSAAGSIRNPMKGKLTVVDKVSGTSNTYKSGETMSAGDSSLTKTAQSALRAGSSAAGSAAATPVVKKLVWVCGTE